MVEMSGKIQKWGNSRAIRLPKEVLEASEIGEGDAVLILADRNGIRIRKQETFETLDDLFKDYKGNYHPTETDMGSPVGKEVW